MVAIPTREPWMMWRTFREKKRDAYADWLAPLWLRNSDYLCPVYRDDKKENIVFCIPSMQASAATAEMSYDKEAPVFIHIGKKPNG